MTSSEDNTRHGGGHVSAPIEALLATVRQNLSHSHGMYVDCKPCIPHAALDAIASELEQERRWAKAERSGRKQERTRADAAEAELEWVRQWKEEYGWMGDDQDVERGDLQRAIRRLMDTDKQEERCPVCEGVDQPGLLHNPNAPYCTQRKFLLPVGQEGC